MKHYLSISLIITALLTNACNQSPACSEFKNGTFKMIGKEGRVTIVKRYGASQKEYYDGSTIPTTFAVKWVNDCTYKLTPNADVFKKYPQTPRNAVLTVQIVKTKDKTCTVVTKFNFFPDTLIYQLLKID